MTMTADADLLAGSALLRTLSATQRAELIACGEVVRHHAGEVLFAEGKPGDALYLVRRGRVALTVGARPQAALEPVGPGGIVGEAALLHPGPRDATATALDDMVAVRIRREQLRQLLLDEPPAALALLDHLAAQLHTADRDLRRVADTIPRWPALLAILALGGLFLLLPERYTVGPRWTVLLAMLVLLAPLIGSRRLGYHRLARVLAVGVPIVLTLAVMSSAALLLSQLPGGGTAPLTLLREAGLIWVANVITFALWYWEIDGGGPQIRQPGRHASTDFLFPQQQQDDDGVVEGWSPGFLDYLFVAFNTSTAFSPTDTLVLSRRMKGLMMTQSILSLVVIAVLAARAINTLGS
jgi:hypothetical protein